MTLTNRLGRPMLAAMFISGGIDQLRDPEGRAFAAKNVREELDDKLDQDVPLPESDADMVRINGWVQVVAGSLLAMNRLPRLSSLALAGTLVPTTLGAHRFWEIEDEQDRQMQQVQFLKNVAMFGGLLVSAGDTGARPSVGWRTRKVVSDTAVGVADSARGVADSARVAADDARELATDRTKGLEKRLRRSRKKKRARKTADRVTETLVSTKNTASPKLAEAADSASDAFDQATIRANEAFERAQPVIQHAVEDSRTKLRELWGALIPLTITARKYSQDIAGRSKGVARDARVAAKGAVDKGSTKVRSLAA